MWHWPTRWAVGLQQQQQHQHIHCLETPPNMLAATAGCSPVNSFAERSSTASRGRLPLARDSGRLPRSLLDDPLRLVR